MQVYKLDSYPLSFATSSSVSFVLATSVCSDGWGSFLTSGTSASVPRSLSGAETVLGTAQDTGGVKLAPSWYSRYSSMDSDSEDCFSSLSTICKTNSIYLVLDISRTLANS